MILKTIIIVLKIRMLFKKLKERDNAYSFDVIDSYFVESISWRIWSMDFKNDNTVWKLSIHLWTESPLSIS